MKTITKILISILCGLLFSFGALAQQTTSKQNLFKVNLLSLLLRTGSFSYERVLNNNSSVMLGVFYTGYSIENISLSGFGVTPAYRFYLSNTTAPVGFYLSPYARFLRFSLRNTNTNDEGNLTSYGAGLELGYQWVFKDVVALNIFGGLGYASGSVTVNSNIGSLSQLSGGIETSRLLGLALGVAF